MTPSIPTSAWLDAFQSAALETCTVALGFAGCEIVRHGTDVPDGGLGAYLALIGKVDSFQLGLTSTEEGCQALAKAMLGMTPEDPDMEASEVADAVCEIINILAGSIKGRVFSQHATSVRLGLPLFVKGSIQPTERVETLFAEMRFGPVPVALLVIQPRSGPSEK